MDEHMPYAAANGQPTTAGRGRAAVPTAMTPESGETARPSGSAVYRSVYAIVGDDVPAPDSAMAPASERPPYPRSAAEAVWADFAAPAAAEEPASAPAWTPPAVRGRVSIPGQVTATGPEPTSPPPPPMPPEPPEPPQPPMPSPEPFEPVPPPPPSPEPTPQPPVPPHPPAPHPPGPYPPGPQPPDPQPPTPPFPEPPPPPQPPQPPHPPMPPFPPPPPAAEFDREDLDRPMPVVVAVPSNGSVSPAPAAVASNPQQAAPANGYGRDDWRSHFSSAPVSAPAQAPEVTPALIAPAPGAAIATPPPVQRGTVYGSRATTGETSDAAEPSAPA